MNAVVIRYFSNFKIYRFEYIMTGVTIYAVAPAITTKDSTHT